MNKQFKKALSAVLSIAMAVGSVVLPMTASAEGETPIFEGDTVLKEWKFDFGAKDSTPEEGYTLVTPDTSFVTNKVGDEQYGFLGIGEEDYKLTNRYDGWTTQKGQVIELAAGGGTGLNDAVGVVGAGGTDEEGNGGKGNDIFGNQGDVYYPTRFALKVQDDTYYRIRATVTTLDPAKDATVSLYTERKHPLYTQKTVSAGETLTTDFTVRVTPIYYEKSTPTGSIKDEMVTVGVLGENSALSSVEIQQIETAPTVWVLGDSTVTDGNTTLPFFTLQNYTGVGTGLTKYLRRDYAMVNEGEGGLNAADSNHFNMVKSRIKAGDYMYVEYGHNHKTDGPAGYKSCLDKYYNACHAVGAKLIIVSPVQSINSWNDTDKKWADRFGGETNFAGVGKAYVAEKVAAGATDVAFADLTKTSVAFVDKVTADGGNINSAAKFYYQTTKGGGTDASHPNDAGAENFAYCFFEAAKENDDATQKAVLADLLANMTTETPNLVSADVIAGGLAGTAWPQYIVPTTEKYPILIDNVAFNEDGSVKQVDVTVRDAEIVFNTYGVVVVTIYNADGTEKGKVYATDQVDNSTGKGPQSIHNFSSDIKLEDGDTYSVIVIEADADTKPVEGGKIYSAVYKPTDIEKILITNEDNTDIEKFDFFGAAYGGESPSSLEAYNGWTKRGSAGITLNLNEANGMKYVEVSSDGAKNGAAAQGSFYVAKDFVKDGDNLTDIGITGRYVVSFDAKFVSGGGLEARFVTGNTDKVPWGSESITLFTIGTDGAVTANGAAAGTVSATAFTNVQYILDMDLGKGYITVGGGDEVEVDVPNYQTESLTVSPSKLTGFMFGGDKKAFAVDVANLTVAKLEDKALPEYKFTVKAPDKKKGTVDLSARTVEQETPNPIVTPTAEPTVAPTADPTVAPTAAPTVAPTAEPTVAPVSTPTPTPTLDEEISQLAAGLDVGEKDTEYTGDVNMYVTYGTLPTLYALLNVYKDIDDAAAGSREPAKSYMWFQRGKTAAGDKLPQNVTLMCPLRGDNLFNDDIAKKCMAYARKLYATYPNAHFNLFCDDLRAAQEMLFFNFNGIPESQYNVRLLSDGTGSYSSIKNYLYKGSASGVENIDNTRNQWDLCASWYNWLKSQSKKKIVKLSDYTQGTMMRYCYVMYQASAQSNIEYYLQWPELMVSDDDEVNSYIESKMHMVKKTPADMYAELSDEQKAAFLNAALGGSGLTKEDYDNKYLAGIDDGKKYMIISGTSKTGESPNFEQAVNNVIEYFGDEYTYLYKPHPAWPASAVSGRAQYLESKGIKELPAQTPMEVILTAYPQVDLGGYKSSLYMTAVGEHVKFFFGSGPSALADPLPDLYALGKYPEAVFFNPGMIDVRPEVKPSLEPSAEPSDKPITEPSAEPSDKPMTEPSAEPSDKPMTEPTSNPNVELQSLELSEASTTSAAKRTAKITYTEEDVAKITTDGALDAVMIEAVYEDGRLVSVKTIPVKTEAAGEKTVDVEDGSKLMLWSSVEEMEPVAEAIDAVIPVESDEKSASFVLNTVVTAHAKAEPGFVFMGWLDKDGKVVSMEADYTFRLRGDTELTANFVKEPGVEDITSYSITAEQTFMKVTAGATTKMKIVDPVDAAGTPMDKVTNADITWSSSDENVTVDADGVVTIGANFTTGDADTKAVTITGALNGMTKTCTITMYSYAYYEEMTEGATDFDGTFMTIAGKTAAVFPGGAAANKYNMTEPVALDKTTTVTFNHVWSGSNTCGQKRELRFKNSAGTTIFSVYYNWTGLENGTAAIGEAVVKDKYTAVTAVIDPTAKTVTVSVDGKTDTLTCTLVDNAEDIAGIEFNSASSVPGPEARALGISSIKITQ